MIDTSGTKDEEKHRAVHRVSLSALEHNFACVENAANKQRCSVIAVVKADGYGHGAIATALYLADFCGADAFAVATLEEAIHLRRAFDSNPPGRWSKQLASHFHVAHDSTHPAYWAASAASNATSHAVAQANDSRDDSVVQASCMRPPRIRIMVLGPPVGYPRCFDDYHYHGIELMVSGPEVATHLLAWVKDVKVRRRTEVERSANESKAKALIEPQKPRDALPVDEKKDSVGNPQAGPVNQAGTISGIPEQSRISRHVSSTLGNVSGQDLAKEVRVLLMKQKAAADADALEEEERLNQKQKRPSSSNLTPTKPPSESQSSSPTSDSPTKTSASLFPSDGAKPPANTKKLGGHLSSYPTTRKRLRWHALVDSGMGRAGFKTDPPSDGEERKDTVDILEQLVSMEKKTANSPIEFFGMCTHMADARSTSTYTDAQVDKFTALLKRVRERGISVPTLSTDNSAALLTTSLRHFDPNTLLFQEGANSRGYVRVGGAIYGQRPSFPQLKSVSTLFASVRHVAVLREGESVGYDRAYVAPHDVRIATLTIGFADGYPRSLGNRVGKVQIRGEVFHVAGNVCMDMMMVDLGPASSSGVGATVTVGDTAVLWGSLEENEDPKKCVQLSELAGELNTTQSSLTCGLDKLRVRRHFI